MANICVLSLLVFVTQACALDSGRINVMTYNLRCIVCDNQWFWNSRLAAFKDVFARHLPDLLGAQELLLPDEVKQVLGILPEPENWAALFFQDAIDDPDATIFYRRDKFTPLEHGTYWLSPTPDVPFSRGFSPKQVVPRLWNWARFVLNATGQEFFFSTTHFDNNPPCQDKSVPLVLNRTQPWSTSLPIISTGDFNSDWTSEAFAMLTQGVDPTTHFNLTDSFSWSQEWHVDTNQTPPPAWNHTQAIDHIFIAGNGVVWTVYDWLCDQWIYEHNGQKLYPSDHFSYMATIEFST